MLTRDEGFYGHCRKIIINYFWKLCRHIFFDCTINQNIQSQFEKRLYSV